MFLEKLKEIQTLWHYLKSFPELTETKLKNIESILKNKWMEWKDWQPGSDKNPFTYLVDSILVKEFGLNRESETFRRFQKAMLSGLFFDCLELYSRILKQRISKED